MKRYVVTEEELENLSREAGDYGFSNGSMGIEELIKAQDVCRSRPVPEWATHFTCGLLLPDEGENEVERTEEIPK